MIYKTVAVIFHESIEIDRTLETMAAKGWELVTWIPNPNLPPVSGPGGYLVFRRHTAVDPDNLPKEEKPSSAGTLFNEWPDKPSAWNN